MQIDPNLELKVTALLESDTQYAIDRLNREIDLRGGTQTQVDRSLIDDYVKARVMRGLWRDFLEELENE